MSTEHIDTSLGQISIHVDQCPGGYPILFLHGLFLDGSLWDGLNAGVFSRTCITIDMPAHGQSGDVGRSWTQDECTEMLIGILDDLGIDRCVVIGHSWGAITALLAAARYPTRIAALGLFNMPFTNPSPLQQLTARFQKLLALFPRFYAKQVCKVIYSEAYLAKHPEAIVKMQDQLAGRSFSELARIIDVVIVGARGLAPILDNLSLPALAVVGKSDHVGIPPRLSTRVVNGGHVSPREAPEEIRDAIQQILALAGDPN
ncbi:MAG: alpha/beta hydrolase [Gammaproteobacteria bacterium]|nr:alpha/beta hydrolase [Gammaproteobacteria bacterium]